MNDRLGLVGRVVAEKFRVDRPLGEGGFGVVYAGMHLVLGVSVAIKFIKPGAGSDPQQEAETFLREARMLFSLTHPAIVRMYEVGTLPFGATQIPFVVLELLDGVGLDRAFEDRRARGRHFAAAEIVQLMGPLFEGLAVAHQRGICHRDLKPSNLMLTRSPSGGVEPKILDFDTARSAAQVTQSTAVGGFTPLYSAPEQWDPRYGPTSPRTDVFAMGLTLAEMCTLTQVFGNTPHMGNLMAAVTDPTHRPRVSATRPDLPRGIDELVLRATAVAQQDRFPDAAAMYQAFRQVFQEQPSAPYVPPPATAIRSGPVQIPPQALTTNSPFAVSPFAPPPPEPPQPASGTLALVIASVALVGVVAMVIYAGVFLQKPQKYVDEDPLPSARPPSTAVPAIPAPPPTVTLAATTGPPVSLPAAEVSGATEWAATDIGPVERTHHREIEACAQGGVPFTGRAAVTVTTDLRGTVEDTACVVTSGAMVLTTDGDTGALNFCACAEERVRKWKFPQVKKPIGQLKTGSFVLGYAIKPPAPRR